MLVNRKQQSDFYEHHEAPPIKRSLPKLNIALRAQCLVIVVLVAAAAMLITARSEAIVRSGYEFVQMKSQLLSLQKENQMLQLEMAKLKSPQRIESIATSELGMIVPKDVYCADRTTTNVQSSGEKEKKLASKAEGVLKPSKGQ